MSAAKTILALFFCVRLNLDRALSCSSGFQVKLLREYGNHQGVLRTGDANMIDSRLVHAGGANNSRKRRVLFYFSFRRKGKVRW